MSDYDYKFPARRVPRSRPEPEPTMGLGEVVRMRWSAWLIRQAVEAEITVLEARRRVATARETTEEAESDLRLRRDIRQRPFEEARTIVGQEIEIERLLKERHDIRELRVFGAAATPPDALPPRSDGTGPVEWLISDRQIEALAVKAVTRFAVLPPREAERAWAAWRQELTLRLPPYAAAEVAGRAQQLLDLSR